MNLRKVKGNVIRTLVSLLVAGGITYAALNIRLPYKFYDKFDNSKCTFDMGGFEQNSFYDPNGERFLITKDQSENPFKSNILKIEDNTIRISLDDNLEEKYSAPAMGAIGLYQRIFQLINPNIKVKIVPSDEKADIHFIQSNEDLGLDSTVAADARNFGFHNSNGHYERAEATCLITVYDSTCYDSSSTSMTMIFAHELGHAICGFSDYNDKSSNELETLTIMNYDNYDSLLKITPSIKVTPSDLVLMIQQCGLFYNNDPSWINPFSSKEQYFQHINDNISSVCYTENELKLANSEGATSSWTISPIEYFSIIRDDSDLVQ